MKNRSSHSAFTLLELISVIAILGILAALTAPAIKNIAKGQAISAASRQLLDDVGRARQLAISQRTTVSIVFSMMDSSVNPALFPANEASDLTNIFRSQYVGYALFAERTVGDQPGRRTRRYLTSWKSLPEGTFIVGWKFPRVADRFSNYNETNRPFAYTNFPLPSVQSGTYLLPYLAFNSRGQLVSELTPDGDYKNAIIPLALGSISYRDLTATPEERPPGSSTNTMFNHVHIDWITGRARLERQEVQ